MCSFKLCILFVVLVRNEKQCEGKHFKFAFFFFAYVLLPIVLCSVFKRIVYSYLTEQHCASFMLKKFPVKVTEGESFTSRSGDTSVAKPLFC